VARGIIPACLQGLAQELEQALSAQLACLILVLAGAASAELGLAAEAGLAEMELVETVWAGMASGWVLVDSIIQDCLEA
jgi:hypothetical protein